MNKVQRIIGSCVVLVLLFTIYPNNRTLDDILKVDHYYSDIANGRPLDSITFYDLEELKENGIVNLEERHTFTIKEGSEVSYKYLEDRGDRLVLKIVLNHNYSADINQFVVPSEIIRENGHLKYKKPFDFKVLNVLKDDIVTEIKDVSFGVYEISIDKERALKNLSLDVKISGYRFLVVNE
ncbi:hypothetical protein [Bacillus solimangrovi]|uniref:Uncharacterized protein n=1 Tax=Bacillus solimangrovi TaxID=1305675 RepID=A0A1E5LI97_9BACI|nr:hypothetical protein [Bacillus solimangrovi]OEH93791.1 hypothetical protein BFG57_11455 [Bacillus solimangrovi]